MAWATACGTSRPPASACTQGRQGPATRRCRNFVPALRGALRKKGRRHTRGPRSPGLAARECLSWALTACGLPMGGSQLVPPLTRGPDSLALRGPTPPASRAFLQRRLRFTNCPDGYSRSGCRPREETLAPRRNWTVERSLHGSTCLGCSGGSCFFKGRTRPRTGFSQMGTGRAAEATGSICDSRGPKRQPGAGVLA